ncbi:MAG: hypothetical protein JJU41_05355 [Bacteroidetes bacterium]|nr:hypothetical protein [Bacteroidota bacterium]MCH8525420.1 hypothetical protein [Balneolales bacterium]
MKSTLFILSALTLVLVFTSVVLGQPPNFPHDPDQAPISGGLGLLAAAGGAYAWKKLRSKKAD